MAGRKLSFPFRTYSGLESGKCVILIIVFEGEEKCEPAQSGTRFPHFLFWVTN